MILQIEEIIIENSKEVNTFKTSINNINLISRFYEEIKKWKINATNSKFLLKVLNTFASLIIIDSTCTSITFSLTGFRLNVVPITAGVGSADAIGTKLASECLKKKYSYQLGNIHFRITPQSFRKMFQKNLENIKMDQAEYKEFTEVYNKYVGFANGSQSEHKQTKYEKNSILLIFFSNFVFLVYKNNVQFEKHWNISKRTLQIRFS